MRFTGIIVASLILCFALGARAFAYEPEPFDPFVAIAEVRTPSGWRQIEISAFGFVESDEGADLPSIYMLRLEAPHRDSPTGRFAVLIDAVNGKSRVFPVGTTRRAEDRVVWLTSSTDAGALFGISRMDLLLDTSMRGGHDRVFINRACGVARQQDGAWSCADSTGLPLAYGTRDGDISFRVTQITERRPDARAFSPPEVFTESSRKPASWGARLPTC